MNGDLATTQRPARGKTDPLSPFNREFPGSKCGQAAFKSCAIKNGPWAKAWFGA